jgi:hypothetical protein
MSQEHADFSANELVTPTTEPAAVPRATCCRWRSMVQVPLLLFAAGGLGFAGQQMWQNDPAFASLFGVTEFASAGSCGSQTLSASPSCAHAAMASSGMSCCSQAAMALASTTTSCCSQAETLGCAGRGCCLSEAIAEAGDAISALAVSNVPVIETAVTTEDSLAGESTETTTPEAL